MQKHLYKYHKKFLIKTLNKIAVSSLIYLNILSYFSFILIFLLRNITKYIKEVLINNKYFINDKNFKIIVIKIRIGAPGWPCLQLRS